MTHILKNKNLEIHIDTPLENYKFSRFDWTGKIVMVKFQNVEVATIETTDDVDLDNFGKGFYNEFGISTALGYEDTEIGGWFHKIGVGLLKKDDSQYDFFKKYTIDPAEFNVSHESNKLLISCKPKAINGYSYLLKKEIELHDARFSIKYFLQNTGKKDIITDEYIHNFTAINKDLMGGKYVLKLPYKLSPELFSESVNPEQKVSIIQNEITFNGSPQEQFFFGNLTGNKNADATWELINLERKIGISETGSFKTDKVNLWGWKHVISPELFYKINIKPGESTEWSRTYKLFNVV